MRRVLVLMRCTNFFSRNCLPILSNVQWVASVPCCCKLSSDSDMRLVLPDIRILVASWLLNLVSRLRVSAHSQGDCLANSTSLLRYRKSSPNRCAVREAKVNVRAVYGVLRHSASFYTTSKYRPTKFARSAGQLPHALCSVKESNSKQVPDPAENTCIRPSGIQTSHLVHYV
ncbi:hypothetical protein BV22DRAFT_440 [Leucogyrophana mollusca]|uniref:Uncharacterized protein n=1 Tax=Leucogyrophana mollusca TaxID=85980 RepID=A0ACB8C017_9AGAM|nr:hypothetical protein BV22DRAFT_440 [Leucogyrophana mollusca]